MNMLPLRVPPWNTTLMGVVRGIADFYGIECSDAMLYGATGHAFLIHIHPTLCPSGPYTWRREGFLRLLHNLGITLELRGYFDNQFLHEADEVPGEPLAAELGDKYALSARTLYLVAD